MRVEVDGCGWSCVYSKSCAASMQSVAVPLPEPLTGHSSLDVHATRTITAGSALPLPSLARIERTPSQRKAAVTPKHRSRGRNEPGHTLLARAS